MKRIDELIARTDGAQEITLTGAGLDEYREMLQELSTYRRGIVEIVAKQLCLDISGIDWDDCTNKEHWLDAADNAIELLKKGK